MKLVSYLFIIIIVIIFRGMQIEWRDEECWWTRLSIVSYCFAICC